MTQNFLNMSATDFDTPIYRVFSKDRLFKVFQEKKLVLVRPKKWDDPFENFIMNSTGELVDGTRFRIDSRDRFYGQCWTLQKESDAMWRIYAPKKDGIKVKSTIKKLLTELYNTGGPYKAISCFIGKVEYFKKEKLKEQLQDSISISTLLTDPSCRSQASTLLLKRIAFRHEKEVRLIYYSPESCDSDLHPIDVDPHDLFDEITIDPRATYGDFRSWKEQLRSLGYRKKIIRSLLYQVPKLEFKFLR